MNDWPLPLPSVVDEMRAKLPNHPPAADCPNGGPDGECMVCGMRDCPHDDPLHYHHDDCPSCWVEEERRRLAEGATG